MQLYRFDSQTLSYKDVSFDVMNSKVKLFFWTLASTLLVGAICCGLSWQSGTKHGKSLSEQEHQAVIDSLGIHLQHNYTRSLKFRKLTPDLVRNEFARHDLKLTVIDTFVAIAFRESSFYPLAIGVNDNKSYDLGLLQINSIHQQDGLYFDCYTVVDLLDWRLNIEAAAHLYKKMGNFNAWNKSGSLDSYVKSYYSN